MLPNFLGRYWLEKAAFKLSPTWTPGLAQSTAALSALSSRPVPLFQHLSSPSIYRKNDGKLQYPSHKWPYRSNRPLAINWACLGTCSARVSRSYPVSTPSCSAVWHIHRLPVPPPKYFIISGLPNQSSWRQGQDLIKRYWSSDSRAGTWSQPRITESKVCY